MNKLLLYAASCFLFLASIQVQAQIKVPAPSPSAVIAQGVGLGEVRITYSRPALKGRKMFGSQVPYNAVWRTGANGATVFTLTEAMELNGQTVPAGKYALLSIPNPTEWTIILNKDSEAWGAYTYKEANDVLRFKVKATKLLKPEEYFTISFEKFSPVKTDVVIRWENAQVAFTVKQDPDKQILQEIDSKMAAAEISPITYINAANYYFDTNRDLNKAYEWASKALETNKAFWAYHLRAKIAAKIGKCDVALKDTEIGAPLAKAANDPAYVLYFAQLKKSCAGK